jgi:hypothetical protein
MLQVIVSPVRELPDVEFVREAVRAWVPLDWTEKVEGDIVRTVCVFSTCFGGTTVPWELPLLAVYCESPAKEAVMVTVVFPWTVGAVYVIDEPVVEERVPVPDGLMLHVMAFPVNTLPDLSSTTAVRASVPLDLTEKVEGDTTTTLEFSTTIAGMMVPWELPLLPRYALLPENEAVIVTLVFALTLGAV